MRLSAPLVSDDAAQGAARTVFADIVQRGGSPSNFYRTMANVPDVLENWIQLTRAVLNDERLTRALKELIVMRAAQLRGADYVWTHHHPLALRHGLTEEQLATLADWPARADLFDAKQRAVLGAADDLLQSGGLESPTVDALEAAFSPSARVAVVMTIAYYSATTMVHNGLDIPIEADR